MCHACRRTLLAGERFDLRPVDRRPPGAADVLRARVPVVDEADDDATDALEQGKRKNPYLDLESFGSRFQASGRWVSTWATMRRPPSSVSRMIFDSLGFHSGVRDGSNR